MASYRSSDNPGKMPAQVLAQEIPDEATPLIIDQTCTETRLNTETCDEEAASEVEEKKSVAGVLWVLFIATYGTIASEFNDLQSGSWLVSAYMLAMCVGQPLYGKLSDTFGRKTMIQIAYGLFAAGSALCGFSQSMPQLIAARALQGLGGGGMITLVAILITDLLPLRQVATWRSYVNIVQTVGRSSGGAIGGLLAQTFGWRWTLSGQAPFVILGMILVWRKLDVAPPSWRDDEADRPTMLAKLKRVDFLGAFLLSVTIISLLLVLDLGGEKVPWSSVTILFLGALGLKAAISFAVVETKWAKDPIFPLYLLRNYDVITSYSIISLQNASQTALMFLIPLYFEVTHNASPGEAGAYMVPAVLGNTIGGIVTAGYLKRYGRTKYPIILSTIFSGLCYASILVLWNEGGTPVWKSFLIFPGGFAIGLAHSALFVALAAGVGEENMAIAGSGQYLCGTVGSVAGVCAASAVFKSGLNSALWREFENSHIPNSSEIIRKALSDITYVQGLTGKVRHLVVTSYLSGFHEAFGLLIGLAIACFAISVIMKNRVLPTR